MDSYFKQQVKRMYASYVDSQYSRSSLHNGSTIQTQFSANTNMKKQKIQIFFDTALVTLLQGP